MLKENSYYQTGNLSTAMMLLTGLLFMACSSNQNEQPVQQEEEIVDPITVYQTPSYSPDTLTVPEPSNIKKEVPTVLSRYYEEGYDEGYDDGEEDAVMENGWGGQYDDSCPYKGKQRKEFQLGYEEGYEAGYYDNKEGDE